MVIAFYNYGTHDKQQVISILLTDGKHPTNEGKLGDAQTKYEMIKSSKPVPSSRVSNIKLGSHGFEAYDVGEEIKRTYGYNAILKDRYIFEFVVNDVDIHNLDDFRSFIADYILQINQGKLK